jgi:hypothetical protein
LSLSLARIKELISEIPEHQRASVKEALVVQRGVNILMGKPYQADLLRQVMDMLDGKEIEVPKPQRLKMQTCRNSKVTITIVSIEVMNQLWEEVCGKKDS